MSTKFDDVKPFPKTPTAAGSVPGHNRPAPADDAVRDFNEALSQRDGFDARIDALLGSASRAVAHDAETAGRCGELIKQMVAVERVIEDARKTVKEPYFEAGKAVDAVAKAKAGPVADAKAQVNAKLSTFMREEEERRRADQRRADDLRRSQEAEQRAAEDAARAANLPLPEPAAPTPAPAVADEPTRIRGDYGTLASAKTVWKHEVTDWEVAFMAVSENERVRDAIDKAIGAMVRSGTRKIEGVRIYSDTVAQVR